jgi:F-type H+-transporting ATPase subunit c
MKTKRFCVIVMMVMMLSAFSLPVLAADEDSTGSAVTTEATEESTASDSTGSKALAAAICVGLAAAAGAVGMGISIAKTNEGIARQPEAEGKLRTSLMLGLVFIETAIIYALIIAILIIFVL